MEERFYVYGHYKPNFDTPFYVGKGTGGRAFSRCDRSAWWNNIVKKHGFEVKFVCEHMSEEDSLWLEMKLIKAWGRLDLNEGPLINLTDGGDGARNPSKETRRKNGMAHRGQIPWNKGKRGVYDSKTIQRMGEARQGIVPWNRGLKTPEETKQKLRKSRTEETKQKMRKPKSEEHKQKLRRPRSEETKQKMRDSAKNKLPRSKEWCKKISEAKKGKSVSRRKVPLTEEQRKHISEGQTGLVRGPHTDETKRKISEGNRGKLVSEESKQKMRDSWVKRKAAVCHS